MTIYFISSILLHIFHHLTHWSPLHILTLHIRYRNIPSLEAVFLQSSVVLLQDPAAPQPRPTGSAEHGLTGPLSVFPIAPGRHREL